MPRLASVPAELRRGVFDVATARALGVTHRQLAGPAYARVLPRVWRAADHVLTEQDWHAAALAFGPPDARLTGFTRLQQLGLGVGPRRPLQLVVGRDLHRSAGEVLLHRTRRMPEHDGIGVSPTAAFVELCRWGAISDVVAAGDWLLHQRLMTAESFFHLARRDAWREGVDEARWVWPLLDLRSRSVPESRVRLLFHAAGLPRPEVNVPVEVDGEVVATPDWHWRRYRTVAEYEGGHHQTDRGQYLSDLDRYRRYRELEIPYVQVTRELAARPRTLVTAMHATLRRAGYEGPPPDFGDRFAAIGWTVPTARAWVPDLARPSSPT